RQIAAGNSRDELVAVDLEKFLDALDRIAVIIEQVPDALEQLDIVGAIVASPAATFHRLDLHEARLPEAENVLRQIKVVCDLADGAESVRTLVHSTLCENPCTATRIVPANRIHFSGLPADVQVPLGERPVF